MLGGLLGHGKTFTISKVLHLSIMDPTLRGYRVHSPHLAEQYLLGARDRQSSRQKHGRKV